MTIQEAIKSGKPFRRLHWKVLSFITSDELAWSGLHEHDILATDWEIKTEPMVIWANIYPDGSVDSYKDEWAARCRLKSSLGVTRKFVQVIE